MARRLVIASSANPRLKAVRKLARTPSATVCLAEGRRAVAAALEAGACLRELFVAPALHGPGEHDLVRAAETLGVPIVEVERTAFESLGPHRRPDGVLATVERPPARLDGLALPREPLVAVAVAIERPGNLGTIVRTACAAGADALVVADPCTDLYHPEVVRGSLGALFHLPVAETTSRAALAWLREREIRVLATSPAGETEYWRAGFGGAVAVVVGSERHGLPPEWLRAADRRLSIPMPGKGDSVNVAVAAGVVLFEACRRRTADVGAAEEGA